MAIATQSYLLIWALKQSKTFQKVNAKIGPKRAKVTQNQFFK